MQVKEEVGVSMYGCSTGEGDGQLVYTVSRKATRRSACHISVFVDPGSIGVPSSFLSLGVPRTTHMRWAASSGK